VQNKDNGVFRILQMNAENAKRADTPAEHTAALRLYAGKGSLGELLEAMRAAKNK
jgi:hypothetical protein